MASLLSVNVGMPADGSWQGKTVHTGIWKRSVAGPRMVRRLNVEGDGQGTVAAGEPPPVRSYSLSSAPGAGTYRISVKHEPHGLVSGYLHSMLNAGAVIDVAAPRGEFVLEDGSGPVVLVSAGIGVTPVLAMLHKLAADKSEREVWWLHAARDPSEHALAAEAADLLARLPAARGHVFYSEADQGKSDRQGAVAVGRLTAERLATLGIPLTATAYVCGPTAFMTAMGDALTSLGIPAGRVRTELFGAIAAINPGVTARERLAPHRPPGPPGTGPLVTFARTGLSVRYPGDQGMFLIPQLGRPDVLLRGNSAA